MQVMNEYEEYGKEDWVELVMVNLAATLKTPMSDEELIQAREYVIELISNY